MGRFFASYGWSLFRDLGDVNSLDSTVWNDIARGLNLLRSISKVTLDLWIGQETLASCFPALFSHSLRPNISVSSAISSLASLSTFRPRLSNMALNELGDLQILVSTLVLNLQAVDFGSKFFSSTEIYTHLVNLRGMGIKVLIAPWCVV
ncbi:hypothetical protein BRADI_1g47585v3 [Brachypodium distachyon]|uniref:Uncharacterized protein n=1 Tax=Brachypodium distachyon TaxID=15368 RepID=A0A2K2DQ34_BRADI|nr:hypothetical protein BRADI_1g47585v3 [Brachypodium distachyon]